MFLKWHRTRQLVLVAAAVLSSTAVSAKPWKGAELITREEYKYGAFEARIRGAEGSGMITAFFLWKNNSEHSNVPWQEQDFELFGKNGRYQTQAMTPGDPRTENVTMHSLATPIWENYFTYRMEWTPEYLAWYVDGHLVRIETDPVVYEQMLDPDITDPAQLRMSLWAGDYPWSGELDRSKVPAATFVDHIAIYKYTPGEGENDFTLHWRDDFDSINTDRWWFANWTFDPSVSDYIGSRNVAAIDGKLVIAFTDEANTGVFPSYVPADNPPLPPVENADYLPVPVPGRVEAEEPSDYFDTSYGNKGSAECGETNLDAGLIPGTDACHVGWTVAGEWSEYIVTTETGGDFTIDLRAATAVSGRTVKVTLNGDTIESKLAIPQKGWQNYAAVSLPVELHPGTNTIRIIHNTGSVNIDFFDVKKPGADVALVPGRIEAEDYVDFFDTTPGNSGTAACSTTNVDAQATSDADGDCNIGWTVAGEWLEYVVQADKDADFDLNLRVASAITGKTLGVEIDGKVTANKVAVPVGGWQAFKTVTLPLSLTAGEHRVRIKFETGQVNFNYLEFVKR